jgi:hypothetical protein
MFASPVPRRHKGRIAIVTNVARNAVDVNVPIDERRGRGRRSRVVLAPQGLALKVAMMPAHHADDGGKRNGSPGRARISCNPSRGEGRLSPPVPVVYARFAQIFCAEAPGACGHPAFPAPSAFREGRERCKARAKCAARMRTHVSPLSLRLLLLRMNAVRIVVPLPHVGDGCSGGRHQFTRVRGLSP